jgi:ABC-type antimicrobial peptide transport system permease subunit
VISESVSRRFWPDGRAVGSRIRLDVGDTAVPREVVGVVADVRQSAMAEIMPTVYVSAEQSQIYGQEFVLRTTGDGQALVATIKETLRSLDPQLPTAYPRTFSDVLSSSVKRQQLAMALMVLFATLALILATLGVYGIMAYTVLARMREFGIRAALGASRRTILLLVLRNGLATAVAGIAAGMALAMVLSRLIGSMLVGVSAHDLATFVAAPSILAVVALAACLLPAWAATRVDPVEVLRID